MMKIIKYRFLGWIFFGITVQASAFFDFYFGWKAYKNGDLKSAQDYFQNSVVNNLKDWRSLFNLGTMALNEKKYADAINYFEKVLSIVPDHKMTKERLAIAKQYLDEQKKRDEQKSSQQQKSDENKKKSSDKDKNDNSEKSEKKSEQERKENDASSSNGSGENQQQKNDQNEEKQMKHQQKNGGSEKTDDNEKKQESSSSGASPEEQQKKNASAEKLEKEKLASDPVQKNDQSHDDKKADENNRSVPTEKKMSKQDAELFQQLDNLDKKMHQYVLDKALQKKSNMMGNSNVEKNW